MALTKNDIVEQIYEKIGLTKKECVSIVESIFDIMKEELYQGNPVMISGFGKWTVMNKHARKGRNPQTGETMTIDARNVVTFKGATNLRSTINSKS